MKCYQIESDCSDVASRSTEVGCCLTSFSPPNARLVRNVATRATPPMRCEVFRVSATCMDFLRLKPTSSLRACAPTGHADATLASSASNHFHFHSPPSFRSFALSLPRSLALSPPLLPGEPSRRLNYLQSSAPTIHLNR